MNIRNYWYGFKKDWKQFWCVHFFDDSRLISKIERPEIMCDEDWVYVENRRQCKACGHYWNDNGLELRVSFEKWLNR